MSDLPGKRFIMLAFLAWGLAAAVLIFYDDHVRALLPGTPQTEKGKTPW